MKLRTTTPASNSLRTRFVLVTAAIIFAIATPLQISQTASADKYDDQINALQQAIDAAQSQAAQMAAQAQTLQTAVAQIQSQVTIIQSQIDISQAKYNQLVAQIAATEKKIKDSQDALGVTIANLYVDSSVSPLEIIASSKNISDFLDKQEYRSSVRDQLTAAIARIKTLKTQLDQQKADTQKVLADQQSAKDALIAKEDEQQTLLSKTNNSEATYQQMIGSSLAQIAAAKATQAALRARTTSTGGYTLVDGGSLRDYPWNSSNCPMGGYIGGSWVPYASTKGSDGEGHDGHGYGCRQCVSYVAYRVAKATNVYYDDLGNGGSAAYNLVTKHGWRNLGQTPQPGSVGSLWGVNRAPYSDDYNPGHTAYIEDVSADGSKILVTQYNYDYGTGYGMYSEMWLSANFFNQYAKP